MFHYYKMKSQWYPRIAKRNELAQCPLCRHFTVKDKPSRKTEMPKQQTVLGKILQLVISR
jgi:hypothetical protein